MAAPATMATQAPPNQSMSVARPVHWNNYSDRCGNLVARRRDELGDSPMADGA